ncbi:MAG: L-threonylcarbamoyladenylate synthase [Clostridium sp.]
METRRFDKKDVKEVAQYLKEGKVVAFPTDTVYGLGVIYENEEALQALKESKGRPENKPIPTMVANVEQMQQIAVMNEAACKLAKAFMRCICNDSEKEGNTPAYVTNGFYGRDPHAK